jgi:hypothetical protein
VFGSRFRLVPVNDREAMKQRHPSSTRTTCTRSGKPLLSLSTSRRRRVMDGASGAFHSTQKAGTGLARVVCMCQMEVTSLACLLGERRGRAVCFRRSSGECATQVVSSSLCEPLRRYRRTPGFILWALLQNALAHADGGASAGLGRWTRLSAGAGVLSRPSTGAPLHPRPALRRPRKQL